MSVAERVDIRAAQSLKRQALGIGEETCAEGSVVRMETRMAALAFGISVADFRNLGERGLFIIIQPRDDEVVVCLTPSVIGWKRDLWDETLKTLGNGRSQLSEIKEGYLFMFGLTQRLAAGGTDGLEELTPPKELLKLSEFNALWENLQSGGSPEGDPEFLQVLLYSYFGTMPGGTRQVLESEELAPWNVLSN